ncbi:WD40 repeat-like protein [Dichomitus squalens LYAD-421 SS1]|uniref:WD40 repeat-like protein n=1 Tax=Dichomitus squalens (strain LYAD-421) TaxID=732165 RepID=UPI000441489F|nr:WD40 repeat-like protein [Dichomitus squalens LYAD-421 SS1]EJF66173.1 WD40 repeat-like protein [Dichomitus squalens LYAD-421 SS1]
MENDSTFVAPEGVYSITEEHKPSPLAQHTIAAAPILYPTKVSTVSVRFPATKSSNAAAGLSQLLGGNREKEGKKEKVAAKEREDGLSVSSSDDPDDGSPDASSAPAPDNSTSTPTIPHEQLGTPFATLPGGLGKRKAAPRPKHSMRTTSSTFITRLQNSDNLNRALQSKQGETTFLFYNSAKTFVWTEAGTKIKEPLARIYFSAYPTCHDVNLATVSSDRLDIIIGFHTGDILWLDPISSRYGRFNKQGRICSAACTAIRWVPESPNLFLVSHADGTIIVYDKEREDGSFTPQEPGTSPPSVSPLDHTSSTDSQGEWNPLDSIFVTMPPWHPVTIGGPGSVGAKPDKEKTAKNPVSHWRVSRRGIVDFVFSPDAKYLAAISEDGCLRVIDTVAEQLVDCYASYFGAFTCVAWSPDGRFILTGGQDDLVTIFSPWEQRVIARCQGHSSFVTGVAFDEVRCDGRTYRFGSIGEDNKFILWDFSSGALHRPKLHAAHQQRMSMTSTISLALRRRGESTLYLPPSGTPGAESPLPRYHPAPSRNEVAVVQPVVVKHIGNDMLTDLTFLPRGLLTATKLGHIKFWIRPLAVQPRHLRTQSTLRRGSQTDSIS